MTDELKQCPGSQPSGRPRRQHAHGKHEGKINVTSSVGHVMWQEAGATLQKHGVEGNTYLALSTQFQHKCPDPLTDRSLRYALPAADTNAECLGTRQDPGHTRRRQLRSSSVSAFLSRLS